MNAKIEIATLAGGCFWCLEAVYDEMIGVISVESGYSGGHLPNPSYKQVTTGSTGHAEVVQITYNPDATTFEDLLNVFFTIHDPTTLNRQGADIGTQYRSAIFHHTQEQKEIAESTIQKFEQEEIWDDPIVTEVTPFEAFYIAEDYHQEYFTNNPNQPYCRAVVAPKVAKFRKKFVNKLKPVTE